MKRRSFLTGIAASCALLGSKLKSWAWAPATDIPSPAGVVDLQTLNDWIASWPRKQIESRTAIETMPSGRIVEHQEFIFGVDFSIDDLDLDCDGLANLVYNEVDYDQRIESTRLSLLNAATYPAAEKALTQFAARTLYGMIASETGDVCWRIRPETDVSIKFGFEPDDNGPHIDFMTNVRGRRWVECGQAKIYYRMSCDSARFHSLPRDNNGHIRFIPDNQRVHRHQINM